jgi:hypothetical protein
MVILGIDAHKRTHTVVVIDERGRQLGSMTTKATTTADHLELVRWAGRFSAETAVGSRGLPPSVSPPGGRSARCRRADPSCAGEVVLNPTDVYERAVRCLFHRFEQDAKAPVSDRALSEDHRRFGPIDRGTVSRFRLTIWRAQTRSQTLRTQMYPSSVPTVANRSTNGCVCSPVTYV